MNTGLGRHRMVIGGAKIMLGNIRLAFKAGKRIARLNDVTIYDSLELDDGRLYKYVTGFCSNKGLASLAGKLTSEPGGQFLIFKIPDDVILVYQLIRSSAAQDIGELSIVSEINVKRDWSESGALIDICLTQLFRGKQRVSDRKLSNWASPCGDQRNVSSSVVDEWLSSQKALSSDPRKISEAPVHASGSGWLRESWWRLMMALIIPFYRGRIRFDWLMQKPMQYLLIQFVLLVVLIHGSTWTLVTGLPLLPEVFMVLGFIIENVFRISWLFVLGMFLFRGLMR